MYRRQNQSQQPKTFIKRESENPAYDRQSVYDEIIDLDKKTYGPYDAPDDGACYDELTDPDDDANETYDHADAEPGRSTPNPPNWYQGLNAAIYDQPDAGPALPGRHMSNQPTTTPAYLELIDVDEENRPNGTAEC